MSASMSKVMDFSNFGDFNLKMLKGILNIFIFIKIMPNNNFYYSDQPGKRLMLSVSRLPNIDLASDVGPIRLTSRGGNR